LDSIEITKTGTGSYEVLPHFPGNVINLPCTDHWLVDTFYTNCPGWRQPGRILDSIATASMPSKVARNNAKPDNSGFAYVNRSFGVGAAVGLQDLPLIPGIRSYDFLELGYYTGVSCEYNDTSDWTIEETITHLSPIDPNFYHVSGRRPNEDRTPDSVFNFLNWYVQVAWGDDANDVVSLSAGGCCGFRNGNPPYQVVFAAGSSNLVLNQVQCEVDFTPTIFNVSVSVANRTVLVSKAIGETPFYDPEPRGELREWALKALMDMSIVSTTLYRSIVGDAFGSNMQNTFGETPFDLKTAKQAAALPAIEQSLEAALDNILVSLATASFASSSLAKVETTFHIESLRIGTSSYALAIFLTNAIVLVAVIAVSLYTKLFDTSTAFDFADLGSVIVGVSNSNGQVNGAEHEVKRWRGDPTEPSLQNVILELDCVSRSTDRAPSVSVRWPSATVQRQWRASV